jgi:phage protein U
MQMMALGMFIFGLQSVAYQSLQQQLAWRHPSNSRVGVRPARQYAGPDDETITISGSVYPEVSRAGVVSLDDLRAIGDDGAGALLIDGTGVVYGQYVIESLNTTRSVLFADGAPRKIDFSLVLKRVDDTDDAIIRAAGDGADG